MCCFLEMRILCGILLWVFGGAGEGCLGCIFQFIWLFNFFIEEGRIDMGEKSGYNVSIMRE